LRVRKDFLIQYICIYISYLVMRKAEAARREGCAFCNFEYIDTIHVEAGSTGGGFHFLPGS